MKNQRYERLRILMRQYHRNHPWPLTNGLFIPHVYRENRQETRWDDVGFILNGRRVMVWWTHPQTAYEDEIAKRAHQEAAPILERLSLGTNSKARLRDGHRMNKAISIPPAQWADTTKTYAEHVEAIEKRLRQEGIDYTPVPSLVIKWYPWGVGMELCAPLKIVGIDDIRSLASLARQLIRRQTTLADILPTAL